MPRFDHRCDECGEEREVSIRVVDIDTTDVRCQQGHPMRRIFSPAVMIWKGKFSPEYWGYQEKRSDGLTPLAE